MSKRLTDSKPTLALGTFKPTDHIVAALPNDDAASQTAQALRDGGLDAGDIAQYSAADMHGYLAESTDKASGAAGFGYEISLMRRWQELARDNCGWLLIYAPKDDVTEQVKQTLQQGGARFAVKYHLLVTEDLVTEPSP